MEALQAAKVTDMQQIVKSMGVDQVDILMKYIYRGLASPEQFNSGILLQWHEKVCSCFFDCSVMIYIDLSLWLSLILHLSNNLSAFLNQVLEVGGVGSIVRVLTDRKTV